VTAAPIEESDGSVANGIKRELKVVDAAAFSVGLIGPVGGMALLGAGAVAIIGRAAIWAFVFALVAVALTAYSFTRLARYIAHSFADAAAGWVVIPEPALVPMAVVGRTPMTGVIAQVYAETLPEPGDVFDGTGGYWHTPGRFRLAGPDERSIRAAARRVMAEYRIDFEAATEKAER